MGSSKTVETPNPLANIFRRLRRSFDKCQILLIIIIILLCKIISDIQDQNTKKIDELSHQKRHSKNVDIEIEPAEELDSQKLKFNPNDDAYSSYEADKKEAALPAKSDYEPMAPQAQVAPQAPAIVQNGPPQIPIAPPIAQQRIELPPQVPPVRVPVPVDSGWGNSNNNPPPTVKEVPSATAVPPGPVPNLVANAFGEGDLSKKPPLKDFSAYQYSTDFNRAIPNEQFIFHNKLPKAGSSTMNNILIMLGRKNRFNYRKLNPHNLVGDSLTAENPLIDFVKNNITSWPFVLLKHHLPMDFEKYGVPQPTYINVIRDPSDWFQSHYYFERFGWTRKEDDRGSFIGSEDDKMRTIDECVRTKHTQCVDITWKYIEFFCGNAYPCQSRMAPESTVRQAMEKAMHNVEKNFFVVGVLEQFDDTLKLFETLLPVFFMGATEVYHSDRIAEKRAATKTVHSVPMNNETRHYFANGPLKYEYELYAFTRQLFNERLRRLGIQSINAPYGP